MATRTLDQVLASLDSTYNPQIDSLRKRQELLPGQVAAEEQGLGAKQSAAFSDITNKARRRGMGFSGIPLSEQAQYNSTEYMPALARLKQSARDQAMSLEDAILGINERRMTTGQSLYQNEIQRDLAERQFAEQQRQFNENLRLQREQADAQRRAATAGGLGGGSLASLFGGGGGGGAAPQANKAPAIDKNTQALYNSVKGMLSSNDQQRILREFNAITTSAGYGNQSDKTKLQLLYQLNPKLFEGRANALKLAGIR